jgi:hypothetical protein
MASILDIYKKTPPKTGLIDSKGKDKTPISVDGGKNLAKDETKLKKARGGELNTVKKYSDSVTNK